MTKILVVEDEKYTNEAIAAYLSEQGYITFSAFDGVEALEKMNDIMPDIIILDIMLPKLSGLAVLHEMRKTNETPVILLTAVEDEYTQSAGFDEKADDYIVKPFSMLLLEKRIQAILRRGHVKSEKITLGNFVIDFLGYTAYKENEQIDMKPKELQLLQLLLKYPNIVLTREQILAELWGHEADVYDRVIDTYIKNLRKKLSLNTIKTVRGVGYKYEVSK